MGGRLVLMGEVRNAYEILVMKPERNIRGTIKIARNSYS
jgi:hypothetical protein